MNLPKTLQTSTYPSFFAHAAIVATFAIGACKGKSANENSAESASEAKPASGQDSRKSDTESPPLVPKKDQAPPPMAELPADDGAQGGAHQWSLRLGGTDRDSARAIAFDKDGNILIGGLIKGEVEIPGIDKMVADAEDAVIIKLAPTGKPLWARHFGGPGSDMIESLVVDSEGNIIVGGGYAEELVIGKSSLPASGSDDGFVAKFDPEGRRMWAKRFGGKNSDSVWSVAVDASNNVYASASISGPTTIGTESFEMAGKDDAYLIAMAPDNAFRWATRIASPGDDFGRGLATDASGSVYWSVEFAQSAKIGETALESVGNRDVAVVKLNDSGAPTWATTFGGLGDESVNDIDVDAGGDVLLIGEFKETVTVGSTKLRSAGEDDVFIVKLARDGVPRWAKSYGTKKEDIGSTVASDSFGGVYAGGWFRGSLTIGPNKLKSNGEKDVFIAKLNRAGEPQWSKNFGGKQVDFVRQIAIAPDNQPVMVGTFFLTVNFGGEPLVAKSARTVPSGEMFAVKLGR